MIADHLLSLCILTPRHGEELFFRKLTDREAGPYGERVAVITSAVVFALIPRNLSQVFYAFTLDWRWGMSTSKQAISSIPSPRTLRDPDRPRDRAFIVLHASDARRLSIRWPLGEMSIAGLILLIRYRKRVHFERGPLNCRTGNLPFSTIPA
jgi:hypothetical protein